MQVPKNFVAEPFEYHRELVFTVESLTNLGMGVGRVDGWVVMVPFVIPCLLYTSPSPRDLSTSRMPSSA